MLRWAKLTSWSYVNSAPYYHTLGDLCMKYIKWFYFCLLLGLILTVALPLHADTFVWDTSPDPGYQSGDGYWNSWAWNIDGSGTSQVYWVDSNDAVFSANGPATINTYGETASSVTFFGTGYTVDSPYGYGFTNNGDYIMNADATISAPLLGKLLVGGPGALTISGGYTGATSNLVLANGAYREGHLVQNGGDVVMLPGTYTLLSGLGLDGHKGTYTLNDGTLDAGQGLYLGWGTGSTGTFIQNGGTVSSGGEGVRMSVLNGTGNYYLNGGTLVSYLNSFHEGQDHFYFGGGTFKALVSFSTDNGFAGHTMDTTIQSGATAFIDTNACDVSWLGVIQGAVVGGVGDAGLTKQGLGTLTLGPANTYTGNTDVVNGILKVTGNTSLGAGHVTCHWDVTNPQAPVGGGVDLNGCTLANDFTLHGAGQANLASGSLCNSSTTPAEVTGNIILGTEGQYIGSFFGPNGDIKLSGQITGGVAGSYALFKNGGMTLTLSRKDNTFNGYSFIDQGVVEVTKLDNVNQPSSLGQASEEVNIVAFSNFWNLPEGRGQTLRYIGDAASSTDRKIVLAYIGVCDNILDASGTTPEATVTFTGNFAFGASEAVPLTALTLTGSNEGDNTIAGDIVGPVSLVKTGSGTWVLAGTKSYTGDTVINSGLLKTDDILHSPNVTVLGGVLEAHSIVTDSLTIGSLNVAAVPEPSAIALLVIAILGMAFTRHFRRG